MSIYEFLLYLTGWPLAVVLFLGGLYFTLRTKFIQGRLFKESLHVIGEKPKDSRSVSSFGALMIFIGAILKFGTVWDMADISQRILATDPASAHYGRWENTFFVSLFKSQVSCCEF